MFLIESIKGVSFGYTLNKGSDLHSFTSGLQQIGIRNVRDSYSGES